MLPNEMKQSFGVLHFQAEMGHLRTQFLLAELLHRQNISRPLQNLREAEFQVFSQWGEDGIIQYLISQLPGIPQAFVEFGVENYRESNTRYLLMKNRWKGLVLDSLPQNIEFIRRESLYWQYPLTAKSTFVTRENINALLLESQVSGEIGLLSIDIDGNDYWIWKEISAISPWIVICEYNSVLGAKSAVSIPYDPKFQRTKAHHSNLYYGASLAAFAHLAEEKGYALVGGNSAGNNAFFVRQDRLGPLRACSLTEAYVESTFRESRDIEGQLTFLSGSARLDAIDSLPVIDVKTNRLAPLKEFRT